MLKTRQSETAEETQINCKVQKELQEISDRQGDRGERIIEIIARKAVSSMNNKKTTD